MKKLTLKGLAKFITATPANQRKIVADFKHPDPEGAVQALYYQEARTAIETHHKSGLSGEVLTGAARRLEALAASATGPKAVRFRNNARAVQQYAEHFGLNRWAIRGRPRMALIRGDVRISVVPDLAIEEKGHTKLVKLEFSQDELEPNWAKILGQVLFEASQREGLTLGTSDVLVMDIPRGRILKGARLGSRMAREIDAACKNISALWDSVE